MDYKTLRLSKLEAWKNIQILYPNGFDITHNTITSQNVELGSKAKIAGRIMLMRNLGKLTFATIKDFFGKMQIAIKADVIGEELFEFFNKNLDLGDLIGVEGVLFETKTGQKTIEVEKLILLSKCLHPLPEKWHGLADDEICLRQRYLDLLVNDSTMERFKIRYKMISSIKRYLEDHNFIEVETPILQKQASGALATPFATHHKALNIPLYMRIAPETYLKRLIVGGYERVFECGKSFRNEGVDSSHLQEFTMLEFYCVHWDYRKAMKFVQGMFDNIFEKLNLPKTIEYQGDTVDFSTPWKEITYRDLVLQYTDLDLELLLQDESRFIEVAKTLIDVNEYKSLASMIDALYKKHCRPKLINPTIITNQPAVLGPLARVCDDSPLWSDRFQIVVCGLEIVNAYSELVDPIKQRATLERQKELANNGEEEAMEMEEDFLKAMEYGMLPMAGVGIGIDRVVALLTNSESLRDVIFFPSLK